MSLNPDQRAALVAAKAAALVRGGFGASVDAAVVDGAAADQLPGPSAAFADGARGWVLLGADAGLGLALVWARRRAVTELHVLVDEGGRPGVVARRAALIDPAPTVWTVAGTSLEPAEATPPAPPAVPPASTDEPARALAAAGVDVVVEHGEVAGEVLGLEVARVVVADDGTTSIEVGVGRHDREAFALLHDELPTAEALARVVADVRALRRPGAVPHPVSRLVRERWLREQVLADPGLVGAATLRRAESPEPRAGLHGTGVAVAVGEAADGAGVVVACSVGVDPELVPVAADARLHHAPDAHLVLVVPPRDILPVTTALAAALVRPAEVVGVDGTWPV
ncbi:MAG TPA: hypothetical protein VK866_09390 [Acidimicrobiales bacterium]|nr:hypothetical protein [Acidimicrobiales bacterium]